MGELPDPYLSDFTLSEGEIRQTTGDPSLFVAEIQRALISVADASLAPAMAAYMKHHFPFLGVNAPARKLATIAIIRAHKIPKTDAGFKELKQIVSSLWSFPEREYHYIALEMLWRHRKTNPESGLAFLKSLIEANSWWDSSDSLDEVVGDGVLRFPSWVAAMDTWSTDENLWVRRVSIQHQLGFDDQQIDQERLFRIILRNTGDKDFFIRKSIGWALRTLGWYRPDVVEAFVAEHDKELSPLSKREATRNLEKSRARLTQKAAKSSITTVSSLNP
jgi:3-methyladenine DNA glycosylase AlkD